MIFNNESIISERFLYLISYDVATLRCRWKSEHLEKHCLRLQRYKLDVFKIRSDQTRSQGTNNPTGSH